MSVDPVAELIRQERERLVAEWEAEVRGERVLAIASGTPAFVAALRTGMHEALEAMAAWLDGSPRRAEQGLAALVGGEAAPHPGLGVGLELVTLAYDKLCLVLGRELLAHERPEPYRRSMLRLLEGLDQVLTATFRHHVRRREALREHFLGILAHDLRDPLNAIVISTGTLARDARLGEEHQGVVARIARASTRMQHMVDDVVDFARAQLGGALRVSPAPDDMAAICRDAAARARAGVPRDVEVELDLEGDLQGAFDHERVRQALANLLVHAAHHAVGAVALRAHEEPDHAFVTTEVAFAGTPVARETIRQMFDPLAGAEPGPLRRTLALDLFLVEQIAMAHGATVEVETSGAVTRYAIHWPRGPGDAPRAAA